MKKINKTEIIGLIESATNVFSHNNKLIIDSGLKRVIINNIEDHREYLKKFDDIVENKIGNENPVYVYCEENLKMILANYSDPRKREWLAEELNLPLEKISAKYNSMIICYKKNGRYSKQYWREEIEELKQNKNNLEYHAKKYNRSKKYLKEVIKQYDL